MQSTSKSVASRKRTPSVVRSKPVRARVNLSLSTHIVSEARALGLNLSRIADAKLAEAVKEEKERRWLENNRGALEAFNARILREGPWNKDLISF